MFSMIGILGLLPGRGKASSFRERLLDLVKILLRLGWNRVVDSSRIGMGDCEECHLHYRSPIVDDSGYKSIAQSCILFIDAMTLGKSGFGNSGAFEE
jgi:hypothetical protein